MNLIEFLIKDVGSIVVPPTHVMPMLRSLKSNSLGLGLQNYQHSALLGSLVIETLKVDESDPAGLVTVT